MGNLDALVGKFGRTFAAGDHIFQEGDEGSDLFLVHSGTVKIYKVIGDRELTLSVLHEDDFFGEVAALLGEYRTASAVAMTEVTLIAFPTNLIEKVITSQTEVAVRLLKLMARRLKAADELIAILMQNNPQARVVLGLYRLIDDTGEEVEGGTSIIVEVEELAAQIEVKPEDVRTLLGILEKKSIIEMRPDNVVMVKSMEDLAEFYQFLELQARFGA